MGCDTPTMPGWQGYVVAPASKSQPCHYPGDQRMRKMVPKAAADVDRRKNAARPALIRVIDRCPLQAGLALARRARRRLLPRAADAVSSSARCAAVLIIAVWEKAWGKFPSCRLATGSYSSASRPRSFLSPSKRSNSAIASSRRPISARLFASQKLQENAFAGRQSIGSGATRVPAH